MRGYDRSMAEFDGSPLRGPLASGQRLLLETIYEPYDRLRRWPIWQYVDLTMDAHKLDASTVLRSLPSVQSARSLPGSGYGLIWYANQSSPPMPDQPVGLTIAGLWHLEEAQPLLKTFIDVLEFLVSEQQQVLPSPTELVDATVDSDAIRGHLLRLPRDPSFIDAALAAVRELLEHEPRLFAGVRKPDSASHHWTMRLPAALRDLRGTAAVEEYVDQVVRWTSEAATRAPARAPGPVDLPYALGYLDAVWKSETGSHLFARFDPASVARLTQPCAAESDFNSLVSALADVLSQVVTPVTPKSTRRAALEALQGYLRPRLESASLERVEESLNTLISIRHLRVSTQHGDARHRAVEAFRVLDLDFPPTSWGHAWDHIAVLATESLSALREEVQAGGIISK